ncbi:hypothetical protein HYH03_010541 [Edaphochlamys debaryana]|uniref:Uncharacterized protein n=1 Tax=Edaphochlamys debaryana TaxID=47281 RepID=A0A836BWL2_9CHLO|nr:hypothetical protein HYH03_010541 [Edaphochlamys debaryana]|eukprot:KAG2491097.1 hypothetical protein HYH03_010541 [Edaphochlamys debaryana]
MQSSGNFVGSSTQHPQDARAHFQGRELQLHGQAQGFEGNSTYKGDYPAHPIDPRQPISPNRGYAGNGAPFDGTSSYKQDYPAHPMEARPPPPTGQYQPNSAPFDGSTAYRDNYKGTPLDPSAYARNTGARPYQPNTAPFDGASSYKADYPQHPVEPRQAHGGPAYQPNTAPFEGTSSYKSEYQQHPMERRGPLGPAPAPYNPAPFEGSTHYRDDYKAHAIEPRPPHQGGQYVPNSAPFQGSTEARDQYVPHPLDPSAYTRRQGPPPMRPSAPFDGSSTYKHEYRGWKLPPRRPALGVQMVGDRTYTLIPADAPLPAQGKQVFTTVHDNQTEICILVLKGDAAVASRNNVIGQFDLNGLPAGPRGAARVEVTFHVDAGNVLSATATDLDAQRQEQWLRQGSMVARAVGTDIQIM